jgi:hypothetical protein
LRNFAQIARFARRFGVAAKKIFRARATRSDVAAGARRMASAPVRPHSSPRAAR